jgi:hypothetical protein
VNHAIHTKRNIAWRTDKMPYLEKLKSKIMTRDRMIGLEEFKEGKLPYSVRFFILTFGLPLVATLVFIFIFNSVQSMNQEIDINVWISFILTMQLIVIFFQLYFIRVQTKYFKITHEPELIPNAKQFTGTKSKGIYVENLGSTAHRVIFKINTKKHDKLNIGEKHFNLQTLKFNKKKLACEIDEKDFLKKLITIRIEYYNKVGGFRLAVYKKLPNEEDFFPVYSGI